MAKSPGGEEVGRVSIRGVPDTSSFKADLEAELSKIEKQVNLEIPLQIRTDDATVTLDKFTKHWNGQEVSIDVDASTALATVHLKEFTRPRTVPIIVTVNKASLAKASTLIASLSGARLAGDLIKNVSTQLQNLDRSLPKLALVALGIASIASAALSSVGGLATLGAGLAQVAGLAAVIPALIGAFAVGATVLVLALSNAGKELSSLQPKFVALKKSVSDNFWAKAKAPIIDFVRTALPALRTGLDSSAKELGSWSASVVGSFKTALGGGVIAALFAPVLESIQIASTGTGGFAQAIIGLGQVGGQYLPRLAQAVANITTQFGAFITKAASDGSLNSFIESGITAAKQLGSVLASAGSILSGVFKAADASGGGGLASLATVLGSVAVIVNDPGFQTALTTIFAGAASGLSGMAAALGPIGQMFGTLAPVISSILGSAGQAVGFLLGQIADALASPAFATGLTAFFTGIQQGLVAIAPSLPAVAKALGSVGTFAGLLAAQIGPVLGAAISALVPLIQSLINFLTPLIPFLTGLVTWAVQFAPLILGIVAAFLLYNAVTGVFTGLQKAAAIAQGIATAAQWAFNAAMDANPIGIIILAVAALVAGLIYFFTQTALGKQVFANLVSFVGTATGAIAGFIGSVADTTARVFGFIGGIVQASFKGVVNFVVGIFNSIINAVNGVIGGINTVAAGVKAVTGGAIDIHLGKLPNLPKLAMGADILPTMGGTPVILGEGGQVETVVKKGVTNQLLELTTELARRALGATTGNSGPTVEQHIHPSVGMSEETIGRIAADALNWQLRSA